MSDSAGLESTQINGIIGIATIVVILIALFTPMVRRSQLWTVTVTPLASIIGSGFLISAPVLYDAFGRFAVVALVLINLLALGIGLAIRHNIVHFDPDRAAMMQRDPVLGVLGRAASATLSVAYVVSVAFYVSLLSAFGLAIFGVDNHLFVKLTSSVVLFAIAAVGLARGLHGLEAVEKVAVNSKMAIIGGLVVVLLVFHLRGAPNVEHVTPALGSHQLRLLGGLLIITQGFETTKYMAAEYAVKVRVRALLLSQILALVVYVAFVSLVGSLVSGVDAKSETAIIGIIAKLSGLLGIALSLGAVFSQFSAAVADTVGAGGIIAQETASKQFTKKRSYAAIAAAAAAVIWLSDVFTVMAFASRSFAVYYGIQCVIATITAARAPRSGLRTSKLVGFPLLAVIAFAIGVFAIPAE